MRLGFACAWDARPELTWSHTPWNLRAALRERAGADEVADVGVTFPPAVRLGLKAACARRRDRRWVSMWRHSRAARAYGEAALRAGLRRSPCEVVLQVQDLAALDLPYLLYQDLSYDVLVEHADRPGGLRHFPTLSRDAVLRLRDRQRDVYAGAAGVLAMSRWFADHLVTVSGVPAAKVHVVRPGASAVTAPADEACRAARLERPRRRLLFVGRDFATKGGDLVVGALRLLRRDLDPAITLTVVGPREWPLPGAVPDGVRFLGLLPVDRLPALYAEHDLFVLPSRFEGFGIAFVEALAQGLPCVARRAYAMPEIVTPGRNGALVGGGESDGDGDGDGDGGMGGAGGMGGGTGGGGTDPRVREVAEAVASVLADDAIYRQTAAAAGDVARYYSWQRAADEVWAVARPAGTG